MSRNKAVKRSRAAEHVVWLKFVAVIEQQLCLSCSVYCKCLPRFGERADTLLNIWRRCPQGQVKTLQYKTQVHRRTKSTSSLQDNKHNIQHSWLMSTHTSLQSLSFIYSNSQDQTRPVTWSLTVTDTWSNFRYWIQGKGNSQQTCWLGIKPRSAAWKAAMLTTTPPRLQCLLIRLRTHGWMLYPTVRPAWHEEKNNVGSTAAGWSTQMIQLQRDFLHPDVKHIVLLSYSW